MAAQFDTAPILSDEPFRKRLVAGDHAAFNLLVSRYTTVLINFVQSRLPSLNTQAIEDVIQGVFCKLWKDRQQLTINSREDIQFLLQAMSKNAAIDYLRRQQLRKYQALSIEIPSSESHPAAQMHTQELTERLQSALAELTELQRTTIELKMAGLSAGKIAEQQSCSLKAVERRVEAGYKHLRERLNPEDGRSTSE